MTREPVSSCCFAPIEQGEALGHPGVVVALLCSSCRKVTRRAWDSLPPPGTFEASPEKPFREFDYR